MDVSIGTVERRLIANKLFGRGARKVPLLSEINVDFRLYFAKERGMCCGMRKSGENFFGAMNPQRIYLFFTADDMFDAQRNSRSTQSKQNQQ